MGGYYRITFDPEVENMWFISKPVDPAGNTIDPRLFTSCKRYGPTAGELMLPVRVPGRKAQFSFGSFDMPVVTGEIGRKIQDFVSGEVELLPARTPDVPGLAILNVLTCVECIDEQRTVGSKWTEGDGRPDKTGKYRTIVHLYIDPAQVRGHHIFRVATWKIALIVSSALIEHAGLEALEGVRLTAVT
jgi:hypothetical protein